MKFNQLILGLSFVAVLMTFNSCGDDDATRLDSDLSFQFDYSFGDEEFNYNEVYDLNGTAVSFQTVQFYVGGIKLHPEEGDALDVEGKYLLVKP